MRSLLLLLGLFGVLAGCGGDHPLQKGNPRPRITSRSLRLLVADESTVTVRTLVAGVPVKIERTQKLRCSPPSGPVSSSICRALRDFLSHYRPVKRNRRCFEGSHPGHDVVAEVYGRVAGKRVGTAVLTSGRCRVAARWVRDLRIVTGLADT